MTAIDRVPTNGNFLSPLSYKFVLFRAPHLVWFTQEFRLPGIELPAIDVGSPFVALPHTADHITYENFELTFAVDEDLKNYLELYNWMKGLGFPEDFTEYKALDDKDQQLFARGTGKLSDATMIITTNAKNPNLEIVFKDCHPVALSGWSMATTAEDVNYIKCTVTFKYMLYNINVLGE